MPVRLTLSRCLLVPALWLGAVASALAQAEPGLQLRASATVQHDSNLFRLSDNANVQSSTGHDSGAETIGINSLELSYNKAYSLQRIELGVSLVDYRYQNFDYLNFTARNYNAAWRWSLTPHLHGNLISSRKETQNNFSDIQNNALRTQRNLRTDNVNAFDADFEVTSAWRMLGGVSHTRQVNEQAQLADSDYSVNSAFVGVRYDFASGSTLGYKASTAKGSYLNRSLLPSALQDDAFDQTESDLRLHWVVSGKLVVDANAGYVQRTHPHFSQRNYSGTKAGVGVNWAISGKSSLNADVSRSLGAYQTSYSNFSQTDKLSVGPNWQISAKTALSLRYDLSYIEYLDAPGGAAALSRRDTVHDTTLNVAWQPNPSATLNASFTNGTRSSTLAGTEYHSRMATFSASYSF